MDGSTDPGEITGWLEQWAHGDPDALDRLAPLVYDQLRVIADKSAVETIVRIYLCRDRWQALEQALRPRSVVVIGGRKRWWPTRESRLARRLRRAGHEVILAETE